jgi:hypothetical protein
VYNSRNESGHIKNQNCSMWTTDREIDTDALQHGATSKSHRAVPLIQNLISLLLTKMSAFSHY